MNVTDKVINLDTSRLRIAEQIEFFNLVAYIVEKYNSHQKDILNANAPFKKACQDVESKYKKDRTDKLTRELLEMDKHRTILLLPHFLFHISLKNRSAPNRQS